MQILGLGRTGSKTSLEDANSWTNFELGCSIKRNYGVMYFLHHGFVDVTISQDTVFPALLHTAPKSRPFIGVTSWFYF